MEDKFILIHSIQERGEGTMLMVISMARGWAGGEGNIIGNSKKLSVLIEARQAVHTVVRRAKAAIQCALCNFDFEDGSASRNGGTNKIQHWGHFLCYHKMLTFFAKKGQVTKETLLTLS